VRGLLLIDAKIRRFGMLSSLIYLEIGWQSRKMYFKLNGYFNEVSRISESGTNRVYYLC